MTCDRNNHDPSCKMRNNPTHEPVECDCGADKWAETAADHIAQRYGCIHDTITLPEYLRQLVKSRQAAIPRYSCTCPNCTHLSSCAVHNGPAYPAGPCDCGAWADEWALKLHPTKHPDENIERWKRKVTDIANALRAVADLREVIGERRGRIKGMREAAEIAEAYPESILVFYHRPGGPDGNASVPSRPSHIAAAITARAKELEASE